MMENQYRNLSYVRIFLVSLVFLLTACGLTDAQRDAVSKFGLAASALGEITSIEIANTRTAVIEMRKL